MFDLVSHHLFTLQLANVSVEANIDFLIRRVDFRKQPARHPPLQSHAVSVFR